MLSTNAADICMTARDATARWRLPFQDCDVHQSPANAIFTQSTLGSKACLETLSHTLLVEHMLQGVPRRLGALHHMLQPLRHALVNVGRVAAAKIAMNINPFDTSALQGIALDVANTLNNNNQHM